MKIIPVSACTQGHRPFPRAPNPRSLLPSSSKYPLHPVRFQPSSDFGWCRIEVLMPELRRGLIIVKWQESKKGSSQKYPSALRTTSVCHTLEFSKRYHRAPPIENE